MGSPAMHRSGVLAVFRSLSRISTWLLCVLGHGDTKAAYPTVILAAVYICQSEIGPIGARTIVVHSDGAISVIRT